MRSVEFGLYRAAALQSSRNKQPLIVYVQGISLEGPIASRKSAIRCSISVTCGWVSIQCQRPNRAAAPNQARRGVFPHIARLAACC
jgi:hypothetical protein